MHVLWRRMPASSFPTCFSFYPWCAFFPGTNLAFNEIAGFAMRSGATVLKGKTKMECETACLKGSSHALPCLITTATDSLLFGLLQRRRADRSPTGWRIDFAFGLHLP